MRRRRDGLKPETFPFLAVLLCALGALILLLLVMDRRAKAVARARALAAAQQTLAQRTADQDRQRQRLEAERRAEWERRCQALHDELQQQTATLRGRLDEVAAEADATAQRLRAAEEHCRELRAQIQARRQAQQQEDAAAAVRRREAEEAAARAAANVRDRAQALRDEQAQLTAELRRLEQILADLKEARQRRQRTYALIPYHGKHGESRPPLYVECTAAGLLFHPGRKLLPAGDEAAVRAEVERRAAEHRQPERVPYVLFLVRPEGIAHYYQALAVLRDVKLDYGYEFVDPEWVLEFPDRVPDSAVAAEDKPSPGSGILPGRRGEGGQGVPGTEYSVHNSSSPPAGNSNGAKSGGDLAVTSQPREAGQQSQTPPAAPAWRSEGGPNSSLFSTPGGGQPGAEPPVPLPSGGKKGGSLAAANPLPFPATGKAPSTGGEGPSGEPGQTPGERNSPAAAAASTASSGPSGLGVGGQTLSQPLLPNREWSVSVECRAGGVILYPGGQRFDLAALGGPNGTAALVETIRQMAVRRQAAVRAGEPGYRIQVRFLVRPDGLRAYYLAYPALEALRLPMSRHNLDADEDIK